MNKKKKLLVVAVLLLILVFIVISLYKKDTGIEAKSASGMLTTDADWNLGTLNNISVANGSFTLSENSAGKINLYEIYNNDNSSVTVSTGEIDKGKILDSIIDTYWRLELNFIGDIDWWKINLQSQRVISRFRSMAVSKEIPLNSTVRLYCSNDDLDYTFISDIDVVDPVGTALGEITWDDKILSPQTQCQYVKIELENFEDPSDPLDPLEEFVFYEFELYEAGLGTHTTAPTQIDGQEGSADKTLIEWETFTPTQTTPANTSISYEFRTSANGTDWTSWSAPQTYSGSPLDLTNLTPNRYLQVRSTLTTSDALSTPRIDDYTIKFHNNQKPNKPTAQTVIIGQ